MVVDNITSDVLADDHSEASSSSHITDDTALKDSQSGRSTNDQTSVTSGEESKFVKKESRHVLFLRVFVLLILLSSSAAISVVVYIVTERGEMESFESQYYAAADKVTENFHSIVTDRLPAAGSLIVAMIAHGQDQVNPWPFVTLSSFQQRATTAKDLSGLLYLGFNPIITRENRLGWENYTNNHPDAQWYEEGREYQKAIGIDDLDNRPQVKTDDPNLILTTGVANYIYDFERETTGKGVISPDAAWYLPIWQTSPVTQRSMVNQNRASNSAGARDCLKYHEVIFEEMQRSNPGYGSDDNPLTAEIAWLLRLANRKRTLYEGDVFTAVYFPVFNNFDPETRTEVGVMRAVIHWAQYFKDLLPASIEGLKIVLENGCDEPFTYRIDGKNVVPIGDGDLHDPKFDTYMRTSTLADVSSIADGTEEGMRLHFDECPYSIRVYPSDHMVEMLTSDTPIVITTSVAIVFLFAILMFFAYDRLVERRQRILLDKAKRTHRIVASLFPKNIRDQILSDDGELRGGLLGAKNNLKSFVNNGSDDQLLFGQMPIADFYPECTVLFADIAGFTSWSSSREPAQVFVLLQTLYQAFDEIAKRRKVFKVETIGDSYVACCGVPEADPAHAVKMARFAWECLLKMREITRNLEMQLGPDTGDLSMRFGLHSGPVTAGVLRGQQSRFQLFGDTVNTASRIESTGIPGKIQCSLATAESLRRSGKDHWLEPREDHVSAKGKGIMKTFWLTPKVDRSSKDNVDEEEEEGMEVDFSGKLADQLLKREREIEWVTELCRESVREIVANRATKRGKITKRLDPLPSHRSKNRTPLDEVVDIIKLPSFDSKSADRAIEAYAVKIPENVSRLIREYISIISAAYRKNPFHNFEHACHVTMCVSKFMKRIVSPEMTDDDLVKMKDNKKLASHLHNYSHGINSDPITMFAIVFSAIIHDVDHPGVSNRQFGMEHPMLAERYHNKSVAEQNSLDVAWDVLMDSHFKEMREYIFETSEEMQRFRQVVVNTVLSTDIFDADLNSLRKERWSKAFSEQATSSSIDTNNARATVVIEHIMQASDIAHTFQHWHVYRRFNERLFEEMHEAYRSGRCAANPADFWYEGELKFFDNYVIPLAKKLRDCNVFGVSSDECLNYAERNRMEWESRGMSVVAEYMESMNEKERNGGRQSISGRQIESEESKEETM